MTRGLQQPHILAQNLTTNGDGTGISDANGDYTGTSIELFIAPPPDMEYSLFAFNIMMNVSGAISSGKYGSGASLANSILVLLTDQDGVIRPLTDVFTNADWFLLSIKPPVFDDKDLSVLIVAKTLFGGALKLKGNGTSGVQEKFSILIRDEDMTTRLNIHKFGVAGQKWPNGLT